MIANCHKKWSDWKVQWYCKAEKTVAFMNFHIYLQTKQRKIAVTKTERVYEILLSLKFIINSIEITMSIKEFGIIVLNIILISITP